MRLAELDWRGRNMTKASQPLSSEVSFYLPNSPIISAAEAARVMGFPTREALGKARATGRLEIEMFRLPGRRGWFAATRDVRAWLESALPSHARDQKEGLPMSE